jgi:hypothetical protein
MNLGGTVYAAGATIPGSVLKNVRNLSALFGRGWIKPSQDAYGRTRVADRAFRVRTFTAAERRAL